MHTISVRMRVRVRVVESKKMESKLRKNALLPELLNTDRYSTFMK